jgi:hypothetical protein
VAHKSPTVAIMHHIDVDVTPSFGKDKFLQSEDFVGDDLLTGGPCQAPRFLYWKQYDVEVLFAKPIKNTPTAYAEWKTAPKKRKKKSSQPLKLLQSNDFTVSSSSEKENSTVSPISNSRKENNPPSFKPTFSHSRYSNLQRFRQLSCSYREISHNDDSERADFDRLQELMGIKELTDLRQSAKTKKKRSSAKKVQFAHPLISSLKYRPKTRPEEIEDLYFREDELQDWEDDRETTSSEHVELLVTEDEDNLHVAVATDFVSQVSLSFGSC